MYMSKEWFLEGLTGWNSHLPLLWAALSATQGDVVELGMGNGSTPKLHEVCKDRNLYSYDNNLEYYKQFEKFRTNRHWIEYSQDWVEPIERHRGKIGVLFSDEAPGEIRKYNIAMFSNTAQIIVAHDAEPNIVGYRYDLVRPLFKYHQHYPHPSGTHAAMFSNFIDVSKLEL